MHPGRNELCPCHSGEKVKKCCGKDSIHALSTAHARTRPSPTVRLYAQEETVSIEEMNRLVAMFNAGHYAELEIRSLELLKHYPCAGFVWKVLGVALKSQGKEALPALKKAVEILPNDAEAHNNLALALQDIGQIEAAASSCRRALLIRPDFPEAHNNLSNALRELRYLDAAVASSRRAIELNPNMAHAHHSLAVALRNQGHNRDAEASARRALEINPNLPGAINFMAELQIDQGHFSDAEALFRHAMHIAPESPEAWAGITRIRKMTTTDGAWLNATLGLVDCRLPPRAEARLRYAIGKYHDDMQDYDEAFYHYQRANELGKLYSGEYRRPQQTLAVDTLCRIYNRSWIKREQAHADASARPVFIVGMPRSGTSLAEQILASHPMVHGAGELGFWKNAMALHAPSVLAKTMGDGVVNRLAIDYLQLLQGFSVDAAYVIDKMPDNFLNLGLIHSVFPRARIIHMQRNPIDTCLSIYFQHFNTSHAYAHDLDDLAHYYVEYARAMEHWRATLPAHAILHVPYEGLVADQEAWTSKMLTFINLPWDARCVDFHQCERTVSSASNWQVRQKINQASVERWRNYEKFVEPLLHLIGLTRSDIPAQSHDSDAIESIPMLGNILHRTELSLQHERQTLDLSPDKAFTTALGASGRRTALSV